MADGSVIIKVDADEKAAVKKLHKIEDEIDKLQEQLSGKEQGKSALVQEAETLQKKLSQLRQEAKKYKEEWLSGGATSGIAGAEHTKVQEQIAATKAELDGVYQKIDKYDAEIAKITPKLERQKNLYGETQVQVAQLTRKNTALENAAAGVAKSADGFYKRIKKIAKNVFIFTVLAAAFRALKDHMVAAVKSNADATNAFAQLKGAVLTLAQPLVEILLPAITWVAQALAKVVSVLAQLFAMITGKSFSAMKQNAKALNDEKKALEGVGKAADKATGSLAGFDEINTINTTASSSAVSAIDPSFDFGGELETGNLENLLDLIKMIGAALLAWKLADSFLGGMGKFLVILLAIEGAIHFVREFLDAWQNGIDWDNLLGMLGAATAMVAGLAIAFGSVGAGIGLLIAGISMIVLGFKDAFDNGWNLQNLLTAIAGIILTGLGIALLTGSWIPMLIAAIAAVLLAFTVAYGEGENLLAGVKQMLQGFVDFFVGIFTGDIDRAIQGIVGIFDGLKKAVTAIWDGLTKSFLDFLDNLDQMTGGVLSPWIEDAKQLFTDLSDVVRTLLGDAIDFVRDAFVGLTEFVSGVFSGDMDKALRGVAQIFRSVFNLVLGAFEAVVNAIVSGVNHVIRGINKVLSLGDKAAELLGLGATTRKFNELGRFTMPRIPALATGTVVPPNREFLAMLGDNKTETEIVSPLSTMKQAMLEALQESGRGGGETVLHVYLNGRKMAVEVVKEINNMTRETGKPVLVL